MREFVCVNCNFHFNKQLTLKQKLDKYVPKFCSKLCAKSCKTLIKVIPQRRKKLPQSSKEEKDFGNILKQFFPKTRGQFQFTDYKHHYDFYVPELDMIVEYNGEYWHSKPKAMLKDRMHINHAIKKNVAITFITDKDWKIFIKSGKVTKEKLVRLLNHNLQN